MLRLFLLSSSIGGAMVAGLYAAAHAEPQHEAAAVASVGLVVPAVVPMDEPLGETDVELVPEGIEVPEEAALLVDAYTEQLLDPETGLRFDLNIVPSAEPFAFESTTRPERRRVVRASEPVAPVPRLSADPGRHVILTARSMMARNETVRGSCYRYVSTVFERAGHEGWRTRTIVHSAAREGPYANLDLVRPGDWLYIVNHPERTPVGTHSVLFVSWQDRAHGYANVIEHPGGGSETSGQERGYDVSMTYRIVRPITPR